VSVVTTPRVPFFERLPAIHRIHDAEQDPPDQLRAFTALFERAFGEVHADIESLYHDLFIDTCADWVIPYLADLLGASHLTGDPWTLRAEIADTIALRRRKGTRGAIERLAFDLTGHAVHAVELRDHLVWTQHLNHQRPDGDGHPPYANADLYTVPRGGTVSLRDPAMLSLIDTPFDPFAHIADLRPPSGGAVRYNLPNVAIFTWRLETNLVPFVQPSPWPEPVGPFPAGAPWVARFDVHPLGDHVALFNRDGFDPDARPLRVGALDAMPGPIPAARLTSRSRAGNPSAYVTLDIHAPDARRQGGTGLSIHIPDDVVATAAGWTFRGATLCEWEDGLSVPIATSEIAIDPALGRIAIGAATREHAAAMLAEVTVSYTYGAVGKIGAHPTSRRAEDPVTRRISGGGRTLAAALDGIAVSGELFVVEIEDSATYELDLRSVPGSVDDGGPTIVLGRSLILRAADGQRPIVRLLQPLAFRPATLGEHVSALRVCFEGIYVTGEALDPAEPLVRRLALHSFELDESTLHPGGTFDRHGALRAPIRTAIEVGAPHPDPAFDQVPEIHVRRSIVGPLHAEGGYRVFITDSIIDGGTGPYEDPATAGFAITAPLLHVDGVTIFGRAQVEQISGQGAIFAQPLEVLDNQHGCLKWCWFTAEGNRLPQHYACLAGDIARLIFTSEAFGRPGYAQLADASDPRIRERGPRDDAMGATGFQWHAHHQRNFHIRCRELMPVGVRAVLVPVT
jgi:hypothetical protein